MNLIRWDVRWCRGADGRVDPARIAGTARAFADFDLPCLREGLPRPRGKPGSLVRPGQPREIAAGLYEPAWPEAYCCDFLFVSADLARRAARMEVESRARGSDHRLALRD